MPIISVEIMKTIDEREIQKTTKEKQTKAESVMGREATVKESELNDFVGHLS